MEKAALRYFLPRFFQQILTIQLDCAKKRLLGYGCPNDASAYSDELCLTVYCIFRSLLFYPSVYTYWLSNESDGNLENFIISTAPLEVTHSKVKTLRVRLKQGDAPGGF
ncbi:MAG: hypothetical protein LDL41_25505 [Coleofasciculus sp. S288]|nr:hypothetical protein [Coleofasciculus sp. S288]